jgi:hypothetical protein
MALDRSAPVAGLRRRRSSPAGGPASRAAADGRRESAGFGEWLLLPADRCRPIIGTVDFLERLRFVRADVRGGRAPFVADVALVDEDNALPSLRADRWGT